MFVNTALLSHPVNWIKVGLMAATFILATLYVVQLASPSIVSLENKGN